VKNEQWPIKFLVALLNANSIIKPKFQRKKKWDILPKKDKTNPNEKDFIKFLYKTQNSVFPITFGIDNNILSNIDGNNRINAIYHFITKPFEIFPEYLDEIVEFIQCNVDSIKAQTDIITIFKLLSYTEIINFKYNRFFVDTKREELYKTYLKTKRDEFEPLIEKLQTKLRINGEYDFDQSVKISINKFEGYTTDELCETFEEINKYNSKLTEIELLACKLYNINDFSVKDPVIKTHIQETLKNFYKDKATDEVLCCYKYTTEDKINAYDFMVGFQNYAHSCCELIEEVNSEGLSLFFKIYKTMFGNFDRTFTTENITVFIEKIIQSLDILNMVKSTIFTEKLSSLGKAFETCNKTVSSLQKNSVYLIIISIIGYKNNGTADKTIINSIEKTILYHFFVKDIHDKEQRNIFKQFDGIYYDAGGAYIDTEASKLYKTPSNISNRITTEKMRDILNVLLKENIREKLYEVRANGRDKFEKRRSRRFYEKTLIYYYYKNKIPIDFLANNVFWIEHIAPFGSEWIDTIDIERLGNIIPIIDKINSKRGKKHISEYKTLDTMGFIRFISDMIPSDETYNKFVEYKGDKPNIFDCSAYDDFCSKNENIYRDNFITCVFSI